MPKGQLNIPERKKMSNNRAISNGEKWSKSPKSGQGEVFPSVLRISTVTFSLFCPIYNSTCDCAYRFRQVLIGEKVYCPDGTAHLVDGD